MGPRSVKSSTFKYVFLLGDKDAFAHPGSAIRRARSRLMGVGGNKKGHD
ncbi:BZ3500_MvSof-1268-A1-R1_Chr1-2g01356 [Microbotryum saponariae]|uniref:BZ3500_MvSof-1268-A1-R1_Chr1-2g01356 protein n=1 Tax=Microbotryum saponariae TaxID=289078 RepID=A0A2X0MIB6_9BASI|nr:BZ3500_MvSof-1268-A1-R1_Chr1-2g01356 [Microbotryum saponariae]SCZ97192.1 BZ3501_MvSof-1269-A2-R1_Chr1-2g00955 [Microbotryum saponariae]